MPPVVFEPTISVGEQPQTYALDRATTVIGGLRYIIIYLPLICGRTMRKMSANVEEKKLLCCAITLRKRWAYLSRTLETYFSGRFSCFTRKINLWTLLLFMCLCVYVHITSVIIL
jgi:hypothetical protein